MDWPENGALILSYRDETDMQEVWADPPSAVRIRRDIDDTWLSLLGHAIVGHLTGQDTQSEWVETPKGRARVIVPMSLLNKVVFKGYPSRGTLTPGVTPVEIGQLDLAVVLEAVVLFFQSASAARDEQLRSIRQNVTGIQEALRRL